MIAVSLSKGKSARISEEDAYLLKYDWKAVFTKGKWYAYRTDGKKIIYMHREIMGFPPEVDHIDGDGLHNERGNLRILTHSQNAKNMGMRKGNRSGYKGVTPYARDGNFIVQIMVDGKNIFLGYFDDPRDGALAYDKAARKYHGKYAKTNADLGLL